MILLGLPALSLPAIAEPIGVGQPVGELNLQDQFGEPGEISDGVRHVLIAFEMKVSKRVNKWLGEQDGSFLEDHAAVYVNDISGMPGPISKMFALPKMRKYPFRVLLARDDEFETRIPHEKDKLTVLRLDDDGNLAEVTFAETTEEIAALIGAASGS